MPARHALPLALLVLLLLASPPMPHAFARRRPRLPAAARAGASKLPIRELPPAAPKVSARKAFFVVAVAAYIATFLTLAISHRAQTYFIYLHWLKPPLFYPLHDLRPYRLASSARLVTRNHLRGWHVLPPGPPFPAADPDFESQLAAPGQRVFVFFHGNSGTRACPSKRVTMLKLLSASFQAHVVTFDYSGFGDSAGAPCERTLNADARDIFAWVSERVAPDTDVIVYGQSLGTFAAVDLAAHLCLIATPPAAVILDAPPASLVDAAMTHPIALPFRILPFLRPFFKTVLHEKLDSTAKIRDICVPLLIVHGEKDWMIPVEQGEKLYDAAQRAANADVEFVKFPDCGHNDVNAAEQYLRVLHRFLERATKVPFRERD